MGAIVVGSQGTGNMYNFLKKKETQFIAVCDVEQKHTKKAKQIIDQMQKNSECRTYTDYREFLEKEKMDDVSIALPDHWHGLIYTAAANKGLDIYGEKHLARTVKEGRAIVLFDGSDFSKWSGQDGEVQWEIKGKAMEVVKGIGSIKTIQPFGNIELHVEWRTPKKIEDKEKGQGRGNSGVYI
nr:DUF1080 domain-containing protein [Bacteroidota bacterium]